MSEPKPETGEKLYIVRTRVFAKTAKEAVKKVKMIEPHEAYVDTDWEKQNIEKLDAIGFRI